MKRFFLLEMEFGPDTRLTTDERGFVEVLRTNAEGVADGFTRGQKPSVKAMAVPDRSLIIISPHDD